MSKLEELICNLKNLVNLDTLFISKDNIENQEWHKIRLYSSDYYLYISKCAAYNTMYYIKNIIESYIKDAEESHANEDYLAHLVDLARGFLSASKLYINKSYAEIEDFLFLNTLMDYAIVKNGTVLFNKNIDKYQLDTSLIKLKKLNEFSMFVKCGEIYAYRTKYYIIILSSHSIIDDIIKLAIKAKLAFFDKLYENEIYLSQLENINAQLEEKVRMRTKEIESQNKLLEEEKKKLNEANRRLTELNRHFDKLSRIDPLTKLSNRRDLEEKFKFTINKGKSKNSSFSLVIGDIDFFKIVNDTFGHECGDYVLVKIAELFRENLRMKDVISRYGGEEFVIFLPEIDFKYSLSVIERLRSVIESEPFKFNNEVFHITMSFGLINCTRECNYSECIRRADEALYKAKAKGRNSVVSIKS